MLTCSIFRHITFLTIHANGPKSPIEPTKELYMKIEDLLKSFAPLLLKYVQKAGEKSELEVLLAVQTFTNDLGWPKGTK